MKHMIKRAKEHTKNNWFYIKNFRINSLFWRTFLAITSLLMIPFLALGLFSYYSTFQTVKNGIFLENSSTLDSTTDVISNTLNECDMMSSYIASNDNTQSYMLSPHTTEAFINLTRLARTLPYIYKYIDSIYIYSEFNQSVFVGEQDIPLTELSDTGWLIDYQTLNNRKGCVIPREKNGSYPPLITILKPIYVADEKRGALVMNIDCEKLYLNFVNTRYTNESEFYLIDAQNRILLSRDSALFNTNAASILPAPAETGSTAADGAANADGSVILRRSSGLFGFTCISRYPASLYTERLLGMRWQIILTSLALLIFCFVVAYIVSAKSYKPLRQIISFLNKTAPADAASAKDQNELIYIMDSIRLHIEDKEKMEEILKDRMALLKQSQYEMLQAQINPHFLYNTLETINWMAYNLSQSENPVSTALVNLAAFFRNTLSSSGYLITIAEEISYTKDYLSILDLRYGDLFDLVWNIPPDILDCTIIKICLQPIIENAVYHGFKPKGGKGLLTISGRREQNNILLIVQDDGIGMEAEAVTALNAKLEAEDYSHSSHIGLANVNKRIKIIFGKDYGIHVQSQPNKGTSVYITIPLR